VKKKYIYWNIFGQNPADSWNIHISSVPTKSFRHIASIIAEKMNFELGESLIGHPAALCIVSPRGCKFASTLCDGVNMASGPDLTLYVRKALPAVQCSAV
jgi:hypothetical protein